jgi:hypothetical protein
MNGRRESWKSSVVEESELVE